MRVQEEEKKKKGKKEEEKKRGKVTTGSGEQTSVKHSVDIRADAKYWSPS